MHRADTILSFIEYFWFHESITLQTGTHQHQMVGFRCPGGISQIDEIICREIGMENNIHQTALPLIKDFWDIMYRIRYLAITHAFQRARKFRHQQITIWQESQPPWFIQLIGDF